MSVFKDFPGIENLTKKFKDFQAIHFSAIHYALY